MQVLKICCKIKIPEIDQHLPCAPSVQFMTHILINLPSLVFKKQCQQTEIVIFST